MQEIKNIITHLSEQAKKQLIKKGSFDAKLYFLILYPGQKTAVYYPVPVSEYLERHKRSSTPDYIQLEWNRKKAQSPTGIELKAVCLISDAWFNYMKAEKKDYSEAEIKKLMDEAPLPSETPDRREALHFSICEPQSSHAYTMPYKRKGGKIVFDQVTNSIESIRGGWMKDLFPKNP